MLKIKVIIYSIISVLVLLGGGIGYKQLSNNITLGARTGGGYWIYDGDEDVISTNNQANILVEGIDRYLNFGIFAGSSGYGFRDNSGTMEYKNSGGSWAGVGSGGGGSSSFLGLNDTPSSYSGQSGKCTAVNGSENALEFISCSGGSGTWATSSSDYWLTTKDTDDLAEGSNLYYTDTRVADYLNASSTINVGDWNTAYGWGNHATAGYYMAANFNTDWATQYNATTTLNGFTDNSTNWDAFYNTPSTRITAGTNLSWSGNTLNATDNDTTYTAGTGLTLSTGSFNVNTSQNINTLSNLTTNGFIKTSGGIGTLSVDTNTYLTGNQTITLSGDVSGSGTTAITTTIGSDKVDEPNLKVTNSPTDNYVLSYDSATGGFTWVADATGGSGYWTDNGTWLNPSDNEGLVINASSTFDGDLRVNGELNNLLTMGTPTYTSLQDWFTTTQSAGKLTGGTFTDNGDGSLSVSAGTGIIKTTNSDTGVSKFFNWSADSSVSLTNNSANYIYIEYNAGSPQITSSTTMPSEKNTNILLGMVYREGTDLHEIDAGQYIANYAKNTLWKDIEINGKFQRQSGIMISETGTRNFALTAGNVYSGLTKTSLSAFDSSGTDTFTYYYRDGSGGWTKSTGETQIDNTHYDDGDGTLGTLSDGGLFGDDNYGVHWVYEDIDEEVMVVYGQGDYTLSEAQSAQPPSSIPPLLSSVGGLVGKIIIQKNDSSFTSIQSSFDQTFTPSVVSNHNDLANIQGGSADEYYHLDNADYTELTEWIDDVTLVSGGGLTVTSATSTDTFYANKIFENGTSLQDTYSPLAGSSSIVTVGTITTGVWQGTAIDPAYLGSSVLLSTELDTFSELDTLVADATLLKGGTLTDTKICIYDSANNEIDCNYTDNNTTYTAGTNLTLSGTTFNVDDAFLLNTGDTGTGAYIFSGASLEIPNSTSPVTNAAGEIALDTTDNQLLIGDSGGTARVFGRAETTLFSFVLASTSPDFISGGVIDIPKNTKDGRDITQYRCHVDGGTSVVVNVSDGTNDTETITCATTQTSDTNVSTNSTFTADELWEVQLGTITGTPDYLIFEAYGYITRE